MKQYGLLLGMAMLLTACGGDKTAQAPSDAPKASEQMA